MRIEWDEAKNQDNIHKHGFNFADAASLLGGRRLAISTDARKDYGEVRNICYGYLQERLMVVVFTIPSEGIIRIISFRKANKREQATIEAEFKT